jgi:hypothetical protein
LKLYQQQLVAAVIGHLFSRIFPSSGLASGGQVTAAFKAEIEEHAFRFALADFLVRNDLSAVVDLSVWCGDYHNENDTQALRMLVVYAGVQLLISRLRTTELPDQSGRSILDVTTLAMVSEFDRSPTLSALSAGSLNRPGTNHHGSVSVFLAGAGVPAGKTSGGFSNGHPDHAPFAKFGAFGPVPMDRDTGQPSINGEMISARTIFPTMLEIFGAASYSQIGTNGLRAVPALLRK